MQYISGYSSPLGEILLAADEIGLTGLWFQGQKHFGPCLEPEHQEMELPVLTEAKRWLDQYFSGQMPDIRLPLHLCGTDFQKEVWKLLLEIPHGKTVTYGEIAAKIAKKRGLEKMSAQAVGGAVGRNPVAIIVPCHRVLGADGSLTGYAGGTEKKIALLKLEGSITKEWSHGQI